MLKSKLIFINGQYAFYCLIFSWLINNSNQKQVVRSALPQLHLWSPLWTFIDEMLCSVSLKPWSCLIYTIAMYFTWGNPWRPSGSFNWSKMQWLQELWPMLLKIILLVVCFWVQLKNLFVAFKGLHSLEPRYLLDNLLSVVFACLLESRF